jgi:lactoylglutathione lyase
MVKFAYTILYVQDVVQAVTFYEQAFGFTRRFIHDSHQYAELDTGQTALAFAATDLARANLTTEFRENARSHPPAGIEIGFVVADVAAAMDRAVEAGAMAVVPPTVKPWGQTVAYVRDLDGILVELCTAVGG